MAEQQITLLIDTIGMPTDERLKELCLSGSEEEVYDMINTYAEVKNDLYLHDMNERASKLSEAHEKLVERYSDIQKKKAFNKCLAAEDPMIQAITDMTYSTVTVRDAEDKKIHMWQCTVGAKDVNINPLDLDAFAKSTKSDKKIGHGQWQAMLEKLNYLLCIKKGRDIGDPTWDTANLKNVSASYNMSKIARDLEFKEGEIENGKTRPNPLSNKNIEKTIATIIKAMIGIDYKVTFHDIEFLSNAITSRGGNKKITMPNHKNFCLIFRDVCNKAITGDGYSLESKNIKKQK